jgi:hypothetical protein
MRVAEEVRRDGSAQGDERWGRLYALVLTVLVMEIAGLWILERVFR